MTVPLYFTAPDGERWRVHDGRWRPLAHRHRVVPPGSDPSASDRFFVRADRARYGLSLGSYDRHDLSAPTLRGQLAIALGLGRAAARDESFATHGAALRAERAAVRARVAAGDVPWWWAEYAAWDAARGYGGRG